MRLSHNNGEDKPPINLSTDHINCHRTGAPVQSLPANEDDAVAVPALDDVISRLEAANDNGDPRALDTRVSRGQGLPYDISSTVASQDLKAECCTTSCQPRSDLPKDQPANTQTSNCASITSTNEAHSNGHDDKITTRDEAFVQDDNTYPEGGLAAWLVVFGSFSGMVASFGILNSVGTFQAYLSTHQLDHHSPASIGWIFSIFAFITFFCGVQIGPIFDAKGPRWLVAAGSGFLFAGLMGVAESTSMLVYSDVEVFPDEVS
jgi:hypothetical protein